MEVKELLNKFPNDIPAYIRLNVEINDFLPVEANAEAVALTNGKQCKFCYINAKRERKQESETKILTVQEFQEENPIDIAKRYAEYENKTFDDEMKELFNEVLEILNEELRNQ